MMIFQFKRNKMVVYSKNRMLVDDHTEEFKIYRGIVYFSKNKYGCILLKQEDPND